MKTALQRQLVLLMLLPNVPRAIWSLPQEDFKLLMNLEVSDFLLAPGRTALGDEWLFSYLLPELLKEASLQFARNRVPPASF